jgi:hypothetical protein
MGIYDSLLDEDRDDEDELEQALPYDTIGSSRGPLEPVMPIRVPKQGNPEAPLQQANAVKDTIAQRMAPKPQAQLLQNASPQMPQEASDNSMDDRDALFSALQSNKAQGDLVSNLGAAFSDLAQGVNAPKDPSHFYNQINSQNKENFEGGLKHLLQRDKVSQAIAARNQKAGLLKTTYEQKAQHATQEQANKDRDYALREKHAQTMEGIAKDRNSMMKSGSGPLSAAQDARTVTILNGINHQVLNDPVVKTATLNLESLNKGMNLLNNPDSKITPQILSDAEQDLANSLAFKNNSGTEGKLKRTETETLNRTLAKLKQKYLNKPDIDMRVEDPQLVEQVKNTINLLANDYSDTLKKRINGLYDISGAALGENPRFKNQHSNARTKALELYAPKIENRVPVKKQYNKDLNKTRIVYSNGDKEEFDGQK